VTGSGRAALALMLVAATAGCRDWRERVDPARAAAEPEQVMLSDEPPITFEAKGREVRLTPRATYRITGYAVETSTMLLDEWDFALPMDLALAWGPVADPAALRHMKFHLSGRYVSFWVEPGGPLVSTVATHVANHHLVPATDEVARELGRLRVGDLVTLRGRLVDVEVADGAGRVVHRSATSLVRDDVGSGACEQVYVEWVDVERP
jgi:hypothetical protein